MAPTRLTLRIAAAALPLLLAGCFDEPPRPPSGSPVFLDAFTTGFTPNSFDPAQGAVPTALKVDERTAWSGVASLRIDVPPQAGGFAGGAVLAGRPQDLTGENALVFWAKGSREAAFGKLGFGLRFSGASPYQTTLHGLPLTAEWTRHALPIPDPAKLAAEEGMLWYAADDASGFTLWLDDVKFDRLDEAALELTPSLAGYTAVLPVGGHATASASLAYTDLDGARRSVGSGDDPNGGPATAYFSFRSSNTAVATVDATGRITAVAVGQATVTARLRGETIPGEVLVDVRSTVPTAPSAAPPLPTLPAGDVIALYNSGGGYTNAPVDTWGTSWSNDGAGANRSLYTIPGTGRTVMKYTSMKYVGVDFNAPGPLIDASGMTTLHVDVWTPNATQFSVQLVGFPGGAPGAHAQVNLGSGTIYPYTWLSLELPLTAFAGVDLSALGQLLWLDNTPVADELGTFFIDNVYFHR